MILCGAAGIVMPEPNPMRTLAMTNQRAFLASLSDELLRDLLNANLAHYDRTSRIECHMLDLIRAECARRHEPACSCEWSCPDCTPELAYMDKTNGCGA